MKEIIMVIMVLGMITLVSSADTCWRTWSTHSTKGVADDLGSINSVQYQFDAGGPVGNPGYCTLYDVYRQPELSSNAELWADMRNGSNYNRTATDFDCFTGGPTTNIANLSDAAESDLETAFANDWNFSIGISAQTESGNNNILLSANVLKINYNVQTRQSIIYESPSPNDNTSSCNKSFSLNISFDTKNPLNRIFLTINDGQNNTVYYPYSSLFFAMYNFDNRSILGENDTYVLDIGHDAVDNNITIKNGAKINTTDCIKGNCVTFDGVNDYMVPASSDPGEFHNAEVNFNSQFWLKVNDISTTGKGQTIYEEGGSTSGHSAYFNNSILYFCVQNVNDLDLISTNAYPNDNKWHQVNFRFAGGSSNISIWIDGTIVKSATTSFGSIGGHGSDPTIGGGGGVTACDITTGYFKGSMDEIKFFKGARNEYNINQSSNIFLTKLDATNWSFYMNFYGWHRNATWDKNPRQNLSRFLEKSINNYTYNFTITESLGNINSSIRNWNYWGSWCDEKLCKDGNWRVDETIDCKNENPYGYNLSFSDIGHIALSKNNGSISLLK